MTYINQFYDLQTSNLERLATVAVRGLFISSNIFFFQYSFYLYPLDLEMISLWIFGNQQRIKTQQQQQQLASEIHL